MNSDALDRHITGNYGENDPSILYSSQLEELGEMIIKYLIDRGIHDKQTLKIVIEDLQYHMKEMK